MLWWSAWCLTSILGAAISCLAWAATCARHGYPLTFDLGFAACVGCVLGAISSLITGLFLRRSRRVALAQLVGFAGAGILAIPLAYFSHVIVAVPVIVLAYLFLLGTIAIHGARRWPENCCLACGYDLRGSLGFRRCPECGTPFDASTLRWDSSASTALGVPEHDGNGKASD